ncbi:MAG: hypothetical protein WDN04_26530 [Rhodospirillales bacterium]
MAWPELTPGCALAMNLAAKKTVEAVELVRADDGIHGHQRLDWDHLVAGGRAYIDVAQVFGLGAIRLLGLDLHPVSAAEFIEVVDVQRAHGRLQRVVYAVDRNAQRQRLFAIHVDLDLRRIRAEKTR